MLDGTAGLWCTNAGHNREPIVAAIQRQAAELDFAPTFQFAHPKVVRAGEPDRGAGARPISTTCSSAIPARKRSTPR